MSLGHDPSDSQTPIRSMCRLLLETCSVVSLRSCPGRTSHHHHHHRHALCIWRATLVSLRGIPRLCAIPGCLWKRTSNITGGSQLGSTRSQSKCSMRRALNTDPAATAVGKHRSIRSLEKTRAWPLSSEMPTLFLRQSPPSA